MLTKFLSAATQSQVESSITSAMSGTGHHPHIGDLHRRKTEPAISRNMPVTPLPTQGMNGKSFGNSYNHPGRLISPKQSIETIPDSEDGLSSGTETGEAVGPSAKTSDNATSLSKNNVDASTGSINNNKPEDNEESNNQGQGCSIV